MATVAQIRADLVGSSASFRAEMIAGQRQAVTSLAAIRTEVKSTADSIGLLNKAAAGFIGFDVVKTGVQALLDAQKAAQQIHYSLISATGSAGGADDAYKAVSATAEQLGLDLQSSALGFAQMSAAASANGISMKNQLALFDGLARSSTVLHLSSTQTGDAILALSQIFGKGKIQAQELTQQLGNAIPGVVPRFQQAVMAMTQGTNLAGKSFQQLLEGGDLTVQRFLPALIQALNETGAGAEQAAGGLNAALNRLSSAWFKTKADLSSGLVSSATINGIDLLTSHLSGLTNLAGLAGGVVVSRLAVSGASRAISPVVDYVGQQRDARAAADEVAQLAAQRARDTAAQVESVQQSLSQTQAWRSQAAAAVDLQRDLMAVAYANNEAAQATLTHTANAAALSANFKAQDAAAAAAVVAQRELAQAQANLDAAIASGNVASARQLELEGALTKAKLADAAATEALAAANAKSAEAQAAASVGGLVAKGASSLGSFALGLVGGPWGAAVAAIGGLAYEVYAYNQRADEFRQETESQVKSLQDLHGQIQVAVQDYGTLHAAMGFQQTLDLGGQTDAQLQQQQQKLAALQAQAQQLRDQIAARDSTTSGGGNAIADAFDQRQLEQIQARINALTPVVSQLSDAQNQLAGKFADTAQAIWGKAAPAMEDFLSLTDKLGAPGVREWTYRMTVEANAAQLDQARQTVQAAISKFQADAKAAADRAATDGMNNVQKQQYALRQAVKAAQTSGLPQSDQADYIKGITAAAAPAIQAAAQVDAADAAKKAAQEAADAARKWQNQADTLNNSLQQTHNELLAQLDSTSKLTPAQKQLQDILGGTDQAYNHASSALKAKMLAEAQDNAQLSQKVLLQQQATKDAQAYAVVQENLARIAQQADRERQDALDSIGQGSQQAQDQASLTAIKRQYEDLMANASRQLTKGPDQGGISQAEYDRETAAFKSQLQQQLAAENDYFAQRDAMQADWKNGATAALSDYGAAARDVAGQTKSAFTDAFTGMENALVTFVTTGKLSFTSFATSVLADIARIEIKSAESGLLSYLGTAIGSAFGYDASGGAGSATYNDTGFVSHVNFGGGRASGGPTAAGSLYEVAEQGPELYQSGGRTYLLSGQNGYVTPAGSSSGGVVSGGGAAVTINQTYNINSDGTSSDTSDSAGSDLMQQLGGRMAQVAKQQIAIEMRQGGILNRAGVKA